MDDIFPSKDNSINNPSSDISGLSSKNTSPLLNKEPNNNLFSDSPLLKDDYNLNKFDSTLSENNPFDITSEPLVKDINPLPSTPESLPNLKSDYLTPQSNTNPSFDINNKEKNSDLQDIKANSFIKKDLTKPLTSTNKYSNNMLKNQPQTDSFQSNSDENDDSISPIVDPNIFTINKENYSKSLPRNNQDSVNKKYTDDINISEFAKAPTLPFNPSNSNEDDFVSSINTNPTKSIVPDNSIDINEISKILNKNTTYDNLELQNNNNKSYGPKIPVKEETDITDNLTRPNINPTPKAPKIEFETDKYILEAKNKSINTIYNTILMYLSEAQNEGIKKYALKNGLVDLDLDETTQKKFQNYTSSHFEKLMNQINYKAVLPESIVNKISKDKFIETTINIYKGEQEKYDTDVSSIKSHFTEAIHKHLLPILSDLIKHKK